MGRKTELKLEVYKRYHIPSCNHYMKRPKNAIFLNPSNSLKHELWKAQICYELKAQGKSFITEACRNEKDITGKERRVDIVELDSGKEIEIIYRHETDEQIQKYRKEGVIPIIIEPMICDICKEKYPKRNKKNICQRCNHERSKTEHTEKENKRIKTE